MSQAFKLQWKASLIKMKRRPLQYVSIPIIAGAVGYITNWVGVNMLFYPIEWQGIPLKRWPEQPLGLFGWQGIVPAKRVQMATTMVDVTLTKLLSIKEVFAQLDPSSMAAILSESIGKVIYMGMLPTPVVDHFLRCVSKEVIKSIESLVSIKDIVVIGMTTDPKVLGEFFMRVGKDELIFLVNSGTYFGFMLGLIQMFQWIVYPMNWTLPLSGAMVGWITNWIALKMIFTPIEKTKVGPFTFQGMFLARQKEVSAEFSVYLAANVLTSQEIWKAMLQGSHVKEFEEIVRSKVSIGGISMLTPSMVDSIMKSLRQQLLAEDDIRCPTCKQSIPIVSVLPASPSPMTKDDDKCNQKHDLHVYIDKALDLEALLISRMEKLTPSEFERVLHPIFEEDELTLIIAGGVLGLMAGGMQWWVNVWLDKRDAEAAATEISKATPPVQGGDKGGGVQGKANPNIEGTKGDKKVGSVSKAVEKNNKIPASAQKIAPSFIKGSGGISMNGLGSMHNSTKVMLKVIPSLLTRVFDKLLCVPQGGATPAWKLPKRHLTTLALSTLAGFGELDTEKSLLKRADLQPELSRLSSSSR